MIPPLEGLVVVDKIPEILHDIIDKAGYVGAVLVALMLLAFGAAKAGLFPKFSRRGGFAIAILLFLFFFVALLLPTFERIIFKVHTVDVVLMTKDGEIVNTAFTLRYRLSDRGILQIEGDKGAAEARGFPTTNSKLDVVQVHVVGWKLVDSSPISIVDGRANVVVTKEVLVPPADDKERPDSAVFKPTHDVILKKSNYSPGDITLHYWNRTGNPLFLVLCSYADEGGPDPWKVKPKWFDFPMESEHDVFDHFKASSGWYGIWVRDSRKKYWALRALDLYEFKESWLTIDKAAPDAPTPFVVSLTEHKPI
jgi:hypothetical protein